MSTKVVKTWRIVDTDNLGGDYPNERFVAIDIETKETAQFFADAWNRKYEHSDRYYKVVPHEETVYVLVPGFEP